jgi:hypothetical protein
MIFDTIDKYDVQLKAAFISEADTVKLLNKLKGEFKQENQYQFRLDETLPSSDGGLKLQEHPAVSPADEFNKNLAKVISLLLKVDEISNVAVQKELEVGFNTANLYMDKLVRLGLIAPPDGKRRPRKLIVQSHTDISDDVLELLSANGYTTDDIATAIENRMT